MTHHQEREGRRGREKRQPHRFVFVVERLEERCLLASLAPAATTLAATNVASTAATLNGSVNPNGSSTDTFFQYSTDPSLPANVVTTLAGTAGQIGSADGTGSAAQFDSPYGVAVDSSGNIYVADTNNDTIREITPAGVVTTLAGAPGHVGSADGTGSAARFKYPEGLAVDSAGNVYVADTGNDTIREVTPARVVTTLAGAPGQPGSADGTGNAARFNFPDGVAVDGAGNVYVSDNGNSTIRKITPAGVVTTLAGAPGQPGSADGTGSGARFNGPYGVAVDSAGDVYVGDTGNNAIREITPAGVVTTLAGTAGQLGIAPGFYYSYGLAVDGAGNLYVADTGNDAIREITPARVVTTLAGSPGRPGSADGTGSAARFSFPEGVAVDSAGNVYVADTNNDTIRKLSIPSVPAQSGLTGTSATAVNAALTGLTPGTTYYDRAVAANVGRTTFGNILSFTTAATAPAATTLAATAIMSTGTGATLNGNVNPEGAATSVTFVYGTDSTLSTGTTTTTAQAIGSGTTAAAVNAPLTGLTPKTTYFFQVVATNAVGRTDGAILSFTTALAPTATTQAATNVTSTAATLNGSVNPNGSSTDTLFQFSTDPTLPANVVTTLAGMPGQFGSADGTGSAAQFNQPEGVAVDGAGDVYVADSENDTIRKVTPAGVVTTLAGAPEQNGSADGAGSAAQFYGPEGLAVDGAGNVYVADTDNDTIRKITPAGVVTTLAGSPGRPGSADGTGSAARFYGPSGVAVDGAGYVYVVDGANDTIRKITPAGVVTTLAGSPGQYGSADGTGSAARFIIPTGIALDSAGNLYVSDTGNDTIRKITPAGVVTTLAGAPGQPGNADGTGSAARFSIPWGVGGGRRGQRLRGEHEQRLRNADRRLHDPQDHTGRGGHHLGGCARAERQRRRNRQRRPVQHSDRGGGGRRGQRLRGGYPERNDPEAVHPLDPGPERTHRHERRGGERDPDRPRARHDLFLPGRGNQRQGHDCR